MPLGVVGGPARTHRDPSGFRRRRGTEGRGLAVTEGIGSVVEVLVDGESRQGRMQLKGRTRSNRLVNFEGNPSLLGGMASILIESAGPNSLGGRLLRRVGS